MTTEYKCEECEFRSALIDKVDDHERITGHRVKYPPLVAGAEADRLGNLPRFSMNIRQQPNGDYWLEPVEMPAGPWVRWSDLVASSSRPEPRGK